MVSVPDLRNEKQNTNKKLLRKLDAGQQPRCLHTRACVGSFVLAHILCSWAGERLRQGKHYAGMPLGVGQGGHLASMSLW